MGAVIETTDRIFRRAALRLVPLILAMYIAAFLNRVNVGFAALTMNHDLGFSPEVYGWGTGIFFLGYLVFEVSANLIMEKVGARLWLSRIMITWALVSMAFAWVQGPVSFFVLRFLLGLAVSGFYPGILLFFTYWFPAATRARILAIFCMGIPLANTSSARRCRAGCWASRGGGMQWLAVDVPAGRHPYPGAGILRAVGAARQSGQGLMADGGKKNRSCCRGWRRNPRARCIAWVRCSRIGGVWGADRARLHHCLRHLCVGLLDAHHGQGDGLQYSSDQSGRDDPLSDVSGDPVGHRRLQRPQWKACAALLPVGVGGRGGFAIAAIGGADWIVILGFCLASGGAYSGLSTSGLCRRCSWAARPRLGPSR